MPAGPLDPDRLAAAEFSSSFRGYDPAEVRVLLVEVADALRAAAVREHDLREQLARAEGHLRDARERAATDAEQAAEDGRRQGREMVAEAQRVRERMLGDLARRRRHARQQVEQLMAGRERLLEAFDTVRQTIDDATQEMRTSLPEARQAAEGAGRRFAQASTELDDDDAVAELEAEIEAARVAGLPIVEPSEAETEALAHDAGAADADRDVTASMDGSPLLGERDLLEMAPVELGAEFEAVRIVPADEVTSAEEASAAGDGEPDAGAESPEGEVVDGEDASGVAADDGSTAPVAPEQIDDLFASLRAARAEAVVDARTVLARDEVPPARGAAEDPDDPDSSDGPDGGTPALTGESPVDDGADPDPDPDADAESPVPLALESPPADARSVGEINQEIAVSGDRLASAVKRVLADEQNELLDRLRSLAKRQEPADAGVCGDREALRQRFATVSKDPLEALVAGGMASMAAGAEVRSARIPPLADALAEDVLGPLHERLALGLADNAGDRDGAAAHVRATFREWKTRRVGAMSADAARAAFHAGVLAAAGRSRPLRWVLDDEEDACAECADNALAGPVPGGEEYPTGHRHPPAHDGCRCLLRPADEAGSP